MSREGLWELSSWTRILFYVTLYKLLFYALDFSAGNRNNDSAFPTGILWELNQILHIKHCTWKVLDKVIDHRLLLIWWSFKLYDKKNIHLVFSFLKFAFFFLNLFFKRQNQGCLSWRYHKLICCDGAGERCVLQRQVGVSLHQEPDPKLPLQIPQGMEFCLI